MSTTTKLAAGSAFPSLSFPMLSGDTFDMAATPGWRVLVVYRGKHCPLCKAYFKTLDGVLDQLQETGVKVVAVSADNREKAEADAAEHGWRFPVGYDLTVAQMRELGLYISEPRSPQETDRPFAEPGLFVLTPEGRLQIVDISNAPFARPDPALVLRGIRMAIEKGYPARGTMA